MQNRRSHITSRKKYNEYKLLSDKQSVEEVLFQGAVRTTIQVLYEMGLFNKNSNADEVLKDFLFAERRRPNWEEVNDAIQWFYS